MINDPWEEKNQQYEDLDEEDETQSDNEVVRPHSLLEIPSYEEEMSYWQDN
jgi:hypothetical protein